ncbi:MAG: BON domain-containing protein [Syntrophorhabdaceae bacterium]|nr:BON domain-containing protein [Syntrophorhabdaceae bacterium]MDD4195314.1 BON domain-containing protein [Syntrophorhabdaceae bacterium]
MKKLLLLSVAVLFVAAAFTGCQTPAGRSAGEVVDDAAITTEVKTRLLADDVTKGLAVTVQTFEGTVTLIGAVDTREQINRAAHIARSVKGVKKVDNRLQLKK